MSALSLLIDMTSGIMHDISTLEFECQESLHAPSVITDNTDTSSDTVTGLGTLSGRMVLGLGEAFKRGLENLSIGKTLGMIASAYPHDDDAAPQNIGTLYDDLLELSRCVLNIAIVEVLNVEEYLNNDLDMISMERISESKHFVSCWFKFNVSRLVILSNT